MSSYTAYKPHFGSKIAHRSKRSTGILAAWSRLEGGINDADHTMCFGWVEYYLAHSLNIDGEFIRFHFACVSWHKPVSDTEFNLNPLHAASVSEKIPIAASRFVPVQRISSKCAVAVDEDKLGLNKIYIV